MAAPVVAWPGRKARSRGCAPARRRVYRVDRALRRNILLLIFGPLIGVLGWTSIDNDTVSALFLWAGISVGGWGGMLVLEDDDEDASDNR